MKRITVVNTKILRIGDIVPYKGKQWEIVAIFEIKCKDLYNEHKVGVVRV